MQQAGLAAFREIGDQRGIASTLSNLGNLLVEMGNLPAAEEKYTGGAGAGQSNRIQTRNGFCPVGAGRRVDAARRSGAGAPEVPAGGEHSP